MAFIDTIPAREASGDVREMYARQQANYGCVPNYAKLFCHRPEIMKLWADLLRGIRRNMDHRRFELVTVAAVERLKEHGFGDAEIFDIAAAAAARTFFAQLCEGLGAAADVSFLEIEAPLRERLTLRRPIDEAEAERLA